MDSLKHGQEKENSLPPHGGIFLENDFETPSYITQHIHSLPNLLIEQQYAKTELNKLFPTDDEYTEYKKDRDMILNYHDSTRCENWSFIKKVENLKEAAFKYSDATSAITRHGEKLAGKIACRFLLGPKNIGANSYEIGGLQKVKLLSRNDMLREKRVVFNWWQNPPEGMRLAKLGDYIELIRDSEIERLNFLYET